MLAKTPVTRIHLFDDDLFQQHNAFRAPGAATIDDLNRHSLKVDYFSRIYSAMHRGIVPHPVRLGPQNLSLLGDTAFVFICVDETSSRRALAAALRARGIAVIDVGIGITDTGDGLMGLCRVTTSVNASSVSEAAAERLPLNRHTNNPYATTIQVADLNMLNAALAVLRWKRLRGFYADTSHEDHSVYEIGSNQMVSRREGSRQ